MSSPYFKTAFESYFGGKGGAGVYQTIINQIPPHEGFMSGYLGNCAIMRYKRPAKYNVGCDVDPRVLEAWKKAAASGTYHLKLWGDSFWSYHMEFHLRLIGYTDEWFIYLDPPYPISSRVDARPRYNYELNMEDHRKLLLKIREIPFKVAISTYPNDLYQKHLSDWRRIEFQAKTRGKVATEWLFMNYPEPTELHDYRYLGDNFKKREHIRLKFQRWKNNFDQLPPLEQAMRKQYLFESSKQL